ncbi:unnamed protein product [Musa acuminata subsp. burmannicoides]
MGREAASSEIDNTVGHLEPNPDVTPDPPPTPLTRPPYRRWTPWLVPAIVVANLALFAVTMYVNDCPKKNNYLGNCVGLFLGRFAFQPLKENPLFGPSSSTLEKMGALEVHKLVNEHQGWRLLSCIWLHAGLIHVITNMLSLLFVGIQLEREFGFARIGLLYIMSGFGGSLLSSLFTASRISVGASGALFGLLGGMLSELLTNWTIYANKFAALLTLIFIIVINLAVGLLPDVDNFAHIGGFVSGFLLGFMLLIRPQFGWVSRENALPMYHSTPVKHKHKIYQYILWITAALLLVVGFTIGLIMLFRGVNANDYCPWCRYLSCIPTSKKSCSSSPIYCSSSQEGNNVNLSCEGSSRTHSYFLPDATEARLRELCSQLCS